MKSYLLELINLDTIQYSSNYRIRLADRSLMLLSLGKSLRLTLLPPQPTKTFWVELVPLLRTSIQTALKKQKRGICQFRKHKNVRNGLWKEPLN